MPERKFIDKIVPYQNEFSRLKRLKGIADLLLYSAGIATLGITTNYSDIYKNKSN